MFFKTLQKSPQKKLTQRPPFFFAPLNSVLYGKYLGKKLRSLNGQISRIQGREFDGFDVLAQTVTRNWLDAICRRNTRLKAHSTVRLRPQRRSAYERERGHFGRFYQYSNRRISVSFGAIISISPSIDAEFQAQQRMYQRSEVKFGLPAEKNEKNRKICHIFRVAGGGVPPCRSYWPQFFGASKRTRGVVARRHKSTSEKIRR